MSSEFVLPAPTKRFSNRAENYAKYRPGYPKEIIPFLEKSYTLQPDSRIADIGSGTGLFAEPLLKTGYNVICIEPNEEMRKAGEARLNIYPQFISRHRSAEATGLRNHSVDLITVAQAFHWLEPVATKREFQRILKPGGHIVLAWNIQKASTDFMKAYIELRDTYRIDNAVPERNDIEKITSFFAPNDFNKIIFPNMQLLDFDALKGQLLSSSFIPLPVDSSYENMISALVQLFVRHNENGSIKMEFETIVYSC